MKNFKYIFGVLFAMVFSIGIFTSCDKEDNIGGPGSGGEIIDGNWTEKGNQLIYRESYDPGYGLGYEIVWTLTFEGDSCIRSICEYKCQSQDMARTIYNSYDGDNDPTISISGSTITFDFTEDHYGLSKDVLKELIDNTTGFM